MKNLPSALITVLLTFTIACGGGSGGSSEVSNRDPIAQAPNDFNAGEGLNTVLDGSSSSDPDGSISGYSWRQVSGIAVTLEQANTAIANFQAPSLAPGTSEIIEFELVVTDTQGASSTDNVTVTVLPVLQGNVTYDHVPHHPQTNGLDYSNIAQFPIRGATVELVDSVTQAVAAEAYSDNQGFYQLLMPLGRDFFVRTKAQLKNEDAAIWEVNVVDNTNDKALYVMDSEAISSASGSQSMDLNASSGWTGLSYTEARVAAPFAILDSIYSSIQKFVAVDSEIEFPLLVVNWSENNIPVPGDRSIGHITTTSYAEDELWILGNQNVDTDEYDGHIIVHEWGHYFEDRLSRSDSFGGLHAIGERLDMRVALGEGFGNALSGIVTDDPIYRDSLGVAQSIGFSIDVESNPTSNQGWYSEESAQSIIYDLYDADNDGADNISLGLGPIYQALVNGQRTTEYLTSIYSLLESVKLSSSQNAAAINSLAVSQSIFGEGEDGNGEINDGGDSRNLPVFKSLDVGSTTTVCSFPTNGLFNKLGNHQFIEFVLPDTRNYNFSVVGDSADSDPDIIVYQQGVISFFSNALGNENISVVLSPGRYIMNVFDFGNIDTISQPPVSLDTCIQVSIN